MSDTRVGIAPEIREELEKNRIEAVVLEKDTEGSISGGSITYIDGSTVAITIVDV